MKVTLIRECEGPEGTLPAGTEIDHPHGHRLVALGFARPADEEAALRAHADRLDRERLEAARLAEQQRQAAELEQAQRGEEEQRLARFEQFLKTGEQDADGHGDPPEGAQAE